MGSGTKGADSVQPLFRLTVQRFSLVQPVQWFNPFSGSTRSVVQPVQSVQSFKGRLGPGQVQRGSTWGSVVEASARPGLVRGLVAAGYAYGTCASLLSELLTRGWHCAILGAGLGKAALVQKGVKMSAFLVGNKHIVAMVKSLHSRYAGDSISYYWQGNSYPMLGGQAQRHMGQVLAEQNYRSVAHLYGPDRQGDIVFEPFRLDPSAPLLSPVAVRRETIQILRRGG